jgi:hypothetical protein
MKGSEYVLHRLISNANHAIDSMLDVILPDFLEITQIFHERGVSVFTSTEDLDNSYATVVRELQYYDVLQQKMQHIKRIHLMLADNVSKPEKRVRTEGETNIVGLNHLQFRVSCQECLSSIDTIKSVLQDNEVKQGYVGPDSREVFRFSSMILKYSTNIGTIFQQAEQLVQGYAHADLEQNRLAVESTYSMHSERVVLAAYATRPGVHEAEFLLQERQSPSSSSNIDLF